MIESDQWLYTVKQVKMRQYKVIQGNTLGSKDLRKKFIPILKEKHPENEIGKLFNDTEEREKNFCIN